MYENNTAKHGGAMYITIFSVTDIQVSFFNSTLFCSNTAEFGGAIKMILVLSVFSHIPKHLLLRTMLFMVVEYTLSKAF